ncbi:hypothetical protein UFOVP312_34 [uncultured Caudovirales phage]|uniref:Portal protein n=1 Tax=uncultured Caudovirales phage TaxID=2100421 RepID=A0A6J5LU53_9CAUD|nr:hypothetical protein UFOVP312_34 [uncultured Caudovirales phage]
MDQAKITSDSDFKDSPTGLAARWQVEIEAAQKELGTFHTQANKTTQRYLDKREVYGRDESRVNLFWSTMQVLLSMLYARPPSADVSRSWQDYDDDVARVAGTMLQRMLNRSFDDNVSPWDAAVRQGIEDWLVVGMGQIWLRYEVETEEYEVPAVFDEFGQELSPAEMAERITNEDAPCDYIYWQDFYYSPARTWHEVRWVARRVYMTKDQLVERFGREIANIVPLSSNSHPKDVNDQTTKFDPWSKAEVFEIWCKEKRKVYWYAKGCDVILDVKDDPLGLDGFFPCPKPVVANVTSSNFQPKADYLFAQDQFQELDEINTRITWLTRAAKVVGVYDKSAEGIQRLFNQGVENQLIPVDNWAMFAERGGVKGQVDFIPIQDVVNAIDHLRQYRQDKVVQIYEVLGISDIMRGSSKASETAAAQQIKAQFGSTRIQLKQFYIAEWITGALRIKAEIICKHFQPETIIRRSNIERTPDAPLAMQAIELLKNEQLSEYRINIEADSMAALDWAAERDAAVQFMQGLGAFVSQVAPMAQQVPGAAPVLLSLLQWSVSKFRVSTQIEAVLDQAIGGLKQTMGQPKQPDPMQQAMVQEKQAGAAERAAKAKKTSVEAAGEEMQLQMAQRALGIMQPQPGLPPAQPQMPPPNNMPPMQ